MMILPLLLAASIPTGAGMRMTADGAADFLLEAKSGAVVDSCKRIAARSVKVTGAAFEDDPVFGEVVRFGDAPGRIEVADGGKLRLRDGFTLEAWIWIERAPEADILFAEKTDKEWDKRTLELRLTKSMRFSIDHLALDGGDVIDYTEDEGVHRWPKGMKPCRYYPGTNGTTMNGLTPLESNRWTHVAFTYDAKTGLKRTWVDFGIDRESFSMWHDLAPGIASNPDYPLVLFKGAKNLRVAQVKLSPGGRCIGNAPPVQVHLSENAYGGPNYVHVIPVRDDLPLPLEVTVSNIKAPVLGKTERHVLSDLRAHNYRIPPHVWTSAESEVVVKLFKDGREIYRWKGAASNPVIEGPWLWEYQRGGPYKPGPKHPDWWIEKDCTFTYKGKPIFPLCVYFVRTNAFDQVADLGFTQIALRKDNGKIREKDFRRDVQPYFAKAAARGITIFPFDAKGGEGAGIRFDLDEPWGYSFDLMQRHYQDVRNPRRQRSELPILCTQNNGQRYRETGCVCDVLAPDPYCRGRHPLRFVYDATRYSRRAVDGQKPVLTVIGNYGTWRADYEEVRTMCYLAVAGGATGLAFYSWDEGDEPGSNMDTAKMPEQVELYRKLLPELKAMSPALTTPNLKDGPTVEPASPRGFFPFAKRGRDGKTYVVVCSDLYRTTEKTVVWKTAAGKTAKLVHAPGRAGASPELRFDAAGKASVKLPPQGTAVYAY